MEASDEDHRSPVSSRDNLSKKAGRRSLSHRLDPRKSDWGTSVSAGGGGQRFYSDGFQPKEESTMGHVSDAAAVEQNGLYGREIFEGDGWGEEKDDLLGIEGGHHLPHEEVAVPEEFICPLSLGMMTDPVIIASGITYDRAAIMQWFGSGQLSCPKTGEPLDHPNVCPNVALRGMIQNWLSANSEALGLPAPSGQPAMPSRLSSLGKNSRVIGAAGGRQQLAPAQGYSLLESAEEDELLAEEYMTGKFRRARSAIRPKSQELVDVLPGSRSEKERPRGRELARDPRGPSRMLPPKGPASVHPLVRSAQPSWDASDSDSSAQGFTERSRSGTHLSGQDVAAASGLGIPGGVKMTRRERDRLLAVAGTQYTPANLEGMSSGEYHQAVRPGRMSSVGPASNGSPMDSSPALCSPAAPSPALRSPAQRSPMTLSPAHSQDLAEAGPRPARAFLSPLPARQAGQGQGQGHNHFVGELEGPGMPLAHHHHPQEGMGELFMPQGMMASNQRKARALSRTSSVPTTWDIDPAAAAATAGAQMAGEEPAYTAAASAADRGDEGLGVGPLGNRARALLKMDTIHAPPSAARAGMNPRPNLLRQGSLHAGSVAAAQLAAAPPQVVPSALQARGESKQTVPTQRGGTHKPGEDALGPMGQWVESLRFGDEQERRSASKAIRAAVKGLRDGVSLLLEAEGIDPLVDCLAAEDQELVEHASVVLMTLALHHDCCRDVVQAGAVPLAVRVLKTGAPAARGYCAALLFAASREDEHKLSVRAAGAIPPLVALLTEGTLRSKKDAALALYSLSTSGRCARDIIKAGALKALLKQVEKDAEPGLEEKAVALIASLCRFSEGCQAVKDSGATTVIVDMLDTGSTLRVKEDAAAILLQMSASGLITHEQLLDEGVLPSLVLISQSSTSTSEAKTLLETLRRKGSERGTGKKK